MVKTSRRSGAFSRAPAPADDRRTVDELARVAGTTVRHVRALQSAGLLPPPQLRGRTGYYSDEHRRRLAAVLRLQGEGFSLASIGALLGAWERGATLEDVLGLPPRAQHPRDASADPDVELFEHFAGRRLAGRVLAVVPTFVVEAS